MVILEKGFFSKSKIKVFVIISFDFRAIGLLPVYIDIFSFLFDLKA